MIEVTKKIICTFILLGSFVFSQCDQYNNETQCSLNSSSCYWESDLTNYNCTQFNSSSAFVLNMLIMDVVGNLVGEEILDEL